MTGRGRVVGLIGGTGFSGMDLPGAEGEVATPYGTVGAERYELPGGVAYLIRRHGKRHTIPPHLINYRGNIWALHALGATHIIATAAVGSLRDDLRPGTFVTCDQFLDFTKRRPVSFFDGRRPVVHTDVTEPYCPAVRSHLYQGLKLSESEVVEGGCYVCTEGPRYETAAETRMFRILGGDVVGMTAVPEAVLARELGICFGLAAVVTNYAPGLSPGRISHRDVEEVMASIRDKLGQAARFTAERLLDLGECACRRIGDVR